jgi:hypothetical protein
VKVKTAAFCALVLTAPPAAAEPWGLSFGFYGGYRPPVSATDIHAVLGANGLRAISQPVQTGRYVVVRAVDSSGEVVRVLLNANYGNIVEVTPLPLPPAPVPGVRPTRPYESYGGGPYEPYGQPAGPRPYEPYGQPDGTRPYEPYGQPNGARPYEPYGQPYGTRPYQPYDPYGQASAGRPDLKSEPVPPPYAPNGQSMIPPPGRSSAALTPDRPPLPRPRPATTVARAAPVAPTAVKPTPEAAAAAPSVPGKPAAPATATRPAATAAAKSVPEAAPPAPPAAAPQAGDITGSVEKKSPAESFPPAAPLE